jgi:Ca2+/Na+ antiporter
VPFDWIRKLTIPPCEAAHYDKYFTIIWPYFGIMVAQLIITKSWPTSYGFYLYLPVAVAWSVLFYCIKGSIDPKTLEKDDDEDEGDDKKEEESSSEEAEITERHMLPGNWFIFISIVGMLWGFIWTYFVSGLMIDALTFIGVLTKLSATYLALTIIAIGNALPDAMLTIALAGKGKAELGITGGYAGQLFGLLVGFGLAMLKKSLTSSEEIKFALFSEAKENMLDIIVIMTALISLLVTFVYGHFNKMKFDKTLAYIFGFIYAVFIISTTVIACK